VKPVRRIEGSTSSLNTLENSDGSLTVSLNNQKVFSSDQAGLKEQLLPAFLPMMLNSRIHSGLVVGFGSGITAAALDAVGIGTIHIAEAFPEMVRFSSDVFADDNDDIMTNGNVTITIEDARIYLMRTTAKIDLITSGYALMVYLPDYYTTEFYRMCRERLSDDGLMAQVVSINDITAKEFGSVLKSFTAIFPEVSLWYLNHERMLLLGSKSPGNFDFCQFHAAFSGINRNDAMTRIGITDPGSLIAHLFLGDRQCREYAAGFPENTDDRPVVQFSCKTSATADADLLQFLVTEDTQISGLFQAAEDCPRIYQETMERAASINAMLRKQLLPSYGKP
jgi:hypothetical protein